MNQTKGLALSQSKGFTIVELVVVIAIIGILAAVVLINVTGYIKKANDAAIKSNMTTMITNAVTFYFSSNSSFSGLCADTTYGFKTAYDAVKGIQSGATCYVKADNSTWCSCAKLLSPSTPTYYCVDGNGKRGETGTDCTGVAYCGAATNAVCP